jgi:hypothetical protein
VECDDVDNDIGVPTPLIVCNDVVLAPHFICDADGRVNDCGVIISDDGTLFANTSPSVIPDDSTLPSSLFNDDGGEDEDDIEDDGVGNSTSIDDDDSGSC